MSNTDAARPPAFAGLNWQFGNGRWSAPVTDHFWELWRIDKRGLRNAGFFASRTAGRWRVDYDEGAEPSIRRSIIEQAEAMRLRAATEYREWQAEQERQRSEGPTPQPVLPRNDGARQLAERAAREAAARATQERARYLLSRFREFCVGKASMKTLAEKNRLNKSEAKLLSRLVRETEIKDAERRQQALNEFDLPASVNWPADVVIAAILHLTSADWDEAEIANGIGWSKADSSTGHWLCAILDDEPELAIATGRRMVGKYAVQLERHRVLSAPALEV